MALTTKILLNKTRKKNDGTFPLVIRMTYNRNVINIPTGYSLKDIEWDQKNQCIKSSSKIATNITRLNKSIDKQRSRIYDVIALLEDEEKANHMSIKDIKSIILSNKTNSSMDVYEFIDSIIDELKQARKKGNAEVYYGLKLKLENVHGKNNLSFYEINYSFLKKMEAMHFGNNNGSGGLSVYMRTLRAVYNRAIKAGYASEKQYPFRDYKIKNGDPQRKALSESEFYLLKNVDLTKLPHLNKARKLFMASFYLRGMNWMDMSLLRFKNITGDFERIQYTRHKTSRRFSVKINDKLKEIIYSFHEDKPSKDDFIFPVLNPEDPENRYHEKIKNKRKKLNGKLKKIAEVCEIEPFTIYAARHTYATMGKRKGVPTAVIQESLGHSTEATTQNYLDSFYNQVVDDFDEVIMGDYG